MKILLDNVNIAASNGPNSFGRQLSSGLISAGHTIINVIDAMRLGKAVDIVPDVQLCFIEAAVTMDLPLIQRLDGIYYNNDQKYGNWATQNIQIQKTYDRASGIIFQSPFSRTLVEAFFDVKDDTDVCVIGNGVDLSAIASIPKMSHLPFKDVGKVWMSASDWRPHKRLGENVRYFLEHATETDIMLIAGATDGPYSDHSRITYLGRLDWRTLISYYKCADEFIHLARHDNCPNVVCDARASGCHIICASDAGTMYIAGPDATVIIEDDWEPQPVDLYNPPQLDFTRQRRNDIDSTIDIHDVTAKYIKFMEQKITV